MTDLSELSILLDELKSELTKSIDFTKPYENLLSYIQYVDLYVTNLSSISTVTDRQRRYGILRQISQISKGLNDIGVWESNDKVSAILLKVMEKARSTIKDEQL